MDPNRTRDRTGPDRDWLTYAGLGLPAIAAVVLSFAAWSGLAVQVGVDQTAGPVQLAWLLPLSVDAIAMTATRVWVMDRTVSDQTRKLARWTALATIGLSFAGNALFHLVTVLNLQARSGWWLVVVLITGLPAVLYFQSAHLIVRLRSDQWTVVRPPITADPVVTAPVGPAAPTSDGPDRTLRTVSTISSPVAKPSPVRQTKLENLARMRTEWPDRTPSKSEVMDVLKVRSSGTAMNLRRAHEAWLRERSDPAEDPAPAVAEPTLTVAK